MADTVRTCADLQNIFRDGQSPRSIVPQKIRDLIVSILSVSVGITAAGSDQGSATLLTSVTNVVTTVAAGSGVVLSAGIPIRVMNRGANALAVYPPASCAIENMAANAPFTLYPGQDALFAFHPTNPNQAYVSTILNVAALPTTLPPTAGAPWLDGGVLTVSQPT